MKECLDEGMLQAYFDGELSGASAEQTALHLTSCTACAAAAHEMEREMSLLATTLGPEFEMSVPTERLRNRLEAAIAEQQPSPVRAQSSSPSWLQGLVDLFAVSPQRSLSYAAVAAVLIAVVALGVMYLKRGDVSRELESAHNQVPKSVTPDRSPREASVTGPVEKPQQNVIASYQLKKTPKLHLRRDRDSSPALIPGEQDYLKTIAALDATIKSDLRTMRPSTQVEYEHNLAVIDQAIANTRGVAQKNPGNPETAKFVLSAYQSKVDLLTQVADARLFNPAQK